MNDVDTLKSRIENVFAAAKDKVKHEQQAMLQDHVERQKRLKEYEKAQARVIETVKPRLEALAARAGDRATVTPSVSESRRAARFDFKSPLATITLTFSVSPDLDVRNAVVQYDLHIIPVLWKYDSRAEFSTPIANPDTGALAKWLDDRIVGFVELFVKMHEGQFYEQADYVEDPIARVKFPKFAAGATLDHNGKTHYFVDDRTRQDFMRQNGIQGR